MRTLPQHCHSTPLLNMLCHSLAAPLRAWVFEAFAKRLHALSLFLTPAVFDNNKSLLFVLVAGVRVPSISNTALNNVVVRSISTAAAQVVHGTCFWQRSDAFETKTSGVAGAGVVALWRCSAMCTPKLVCPGSLRDMPFGLSQTRKAGV